MIYCVGEILKLGRQDWRVVAILSPTAIVIEYITAASEPNWSGIEGYQVAEIGEHGVLLDVNGEILGL